VAEAGKQVIWWDGTSELGSPVPPGLYFVRLTAPGGHRTTRLARLD
jgi:hypothetical protein